MSVTALRLQGQTALVTGAAKRLGRAIALALGEAGADVVIHCHRSREEAEKTAADVQAHGVQAWVVQADLADPDGPARLFDEALRVAGPLDILVDNASIFPADVVTDFSDDRLDACLRVNARAPLALDRAFAAQGRAGAIVHLLDCRIVDHDREHAAYHLSKRMLFSLTRMLAEEFAPAVRVNGVAPGLIFPPPGGDESYLERLAHTNPLNRHGDPGDVARAVLYLLASPFVTGDVLFVDGGRHLRGSRYGL